MIILQYQNNSIQLRSPFLMEMELDLKIKLHRDMNGVLCTQAQMTPKMIYHRRIQTLTQELYDSFVSFITTVSGHSFTYQEDENTPVLVRLVSDIILTEESRSVRGNILLELEEV